MQSNQVLNLRSQFRPFIFDVFPFDVPCHCAKSTLVEFLRPVGQPYPALESIQSPFLNAFFLELSWHHRHCHGQPHQFVLVFQLKLLAWVADFASVDGPRVEKDHISGIALNQLSFADIRVVSEEFEPVAFVVRALVAFAEVALSLIVVGVGHNLQSACSLSPHIDQRDHALHALKSLFVVGVLVDVQVLHEGIPSLFGVFVPPGPPADESVETGNQRISVPNFTKDRFDLGPGAQVPGGVGVAPSVGDEEADGPTARPVVVHPSGRILPFDAAAQRLEPLPEIVLRPLHFLRLQDAPHDNGAVVVQVGDPAGLVLELISITL